MRRLALLLLLGLTATAQQQRTGETIEVSLVNIDVVVTDAEGRRVTGLTANDFEIREAGKPQPITHFAEYGPAANAEEAASRPPRTIVVFIESSELLPAQVDEMYAALRKLLRDTLTGPEDRAAIIGWQGSATIRQPFTGDLEVLDHTLARMQKGHRVPSRDARAVKALLREQEAEDAAADTDFGASDDEVFELEASMHQLQRIRAKGVALEALMNSMGALEGRKILVMAMHRFGLFAGAEGTESGQVEFERRTFLSNKKLHDAMIRAANANDVVLYPVYPAGLKWDGMDVQRQGEYSEDELLTRNAKQGNVLFNEAKGLDELAKGTGGLMVWGTRSIAELLPRVAEDLERYYSLAYRAPSRGEDVTRRIEVRAKNPRYKVRSRTQFVEKSDRTRMKEQVLANLYHGEGESAFPIEVLLGERKGMSLPLQVRVEGDGKPRQLSFYVVAGSSLGVASDVLHRAHAFPAGSEFFTADFTLVIDDASDFVSVGVVDEATQELALQRVSLRRD